MSTWPLQYGNSPAQNSLLHGTFWITLMTCMYGTRWTREWDSSSAPECSRTGLEEEEFQRGFFLFKCGIPMWSCYQCELKTLGNNMVIFISWDTFTFLIFLKSPLKLWVSFRKCLVIFLYIFNDCHGQYHENYEQCNTNISWGVRNFD